ncbi:MAG: hypothetical protein QN716_09750, partial [Nitrososphaeraceae archaeon]|nr:hypothetical protein [Nitrososphaeraceae archaeon]
ETPSPLRRSFTSDIRSARTIASIFFNGMEYYRLPHLKMGFDLSLGPSLGTWSPTRWENWNVPLYQTLGERCRKHVIERFQQMKKLNTQANSRM